MAPRLRILVLALLLLGTVLLQQPATATGGIYCTSYEYVQRGAEMSCLIFCVVCFDLDNDLEIVAENCQEKSCWFRQV